MDNFYYYIKNSKVDEYVNFAVISEFNKSGKLSLVDLESAGIFELIQARDVVTQLHEIMPSYRFEVVKAG